MKVILKTGEEAACDWAGVAGDTLWIALTEKSLPEAAALFGIGEGSARIVAVYSESNRMTETFEGYTQLVDAHLSGKRTMIGLQKAQKGA